MADEEIDIFLKWKQENADVASDAASRLDRITDALTRMRLAREAADTRLGAMQGLGLFNLPDSDTAQKNRIAAGIAYLDQLATMRATTTEVEKQHGWWSRIRDAMGDIRNALGSQRGGTVEFDRDTVSRFLGTAIRETLEKIIRGVGDMLEGLRNVPVLGGPAARLGGMMEGLDAASTTAIPILLGLVSAILLVATAIGTLVAGLVVLIAYLGAVTTILGTFLVAGTGLFLLLGILFGGFAALAGGIIFAGAALQGGASAADTLAKATKALGTAQEGLDASQLALAKWWAKHPFGPQNQTDVLTLAGLMDRLRDSQEKMKLAQDAYNQAVTNSQSPLQTLIGNLDTLIAEKIEPLAIAISNTALTWINAWAVQIAPAVVTAATSIMNWVNDRMLPALNGLAGFITKVAPDIKAFGQFVGDMFDRFTAGRGDLFQSIGVATVRTIITFVETLLTWLERLSNWFLEKGPDGITRFERYGRIVQEILGGIGKWVADSLMPALGRFADWVVANWPSISKTMSDVWTAIKTAWDQLAPYFESTIKPLFSNLWQAIKNLATDTTAWVVVLLVLAAIAIIVGAGLLGLYAIFVSVKTAVKDAADQVQRLIDLLKIVQGMGIPGIPGSSTNFGPAIAASQASHSGGTSPTRPIPNIINNKVTVNGADVSNPQATGLSVSRVLKNLL